MKPEQGCGDGPKAGTSGASEAAEPVWGSVGGASRVTSQFTDKPTRG